MIVSKVKVDLFLNKEGLFFFLQKYFQNFIEMGEFCSYNNIYLNKNIN